VAADYSTARRTLALTMGATEAVDPSQEGAVDADGFEDDQLPSMRHVHRRSWSTACAWHPTPSDR